MRTIASCLFCHQEFAIKKKKHTRHHCHEANTDYYRVKSYNYYRNARANKWGTWACCMFCKEEFKVNRSDQRMHGCSAAARDYKRVVDRGVTEGRKGIRIMDNLHPCPKCRVVLTANRFMCSACLQAMGDIYDLDMSIVVEAGTAKRIVTSRSPY